MSLSTRIEKLERHHGLSGDGLDVSSLTDEELEARLAELFQIAHNKQTEANDDNS